MPGAAALLFVLAAPAAALVRGSFTWRVPSDRLNQGEPIESAPFDCAGQRWTLKLSPRTGKRCGVELRYAAKDVGDAVDAAFTLRLGSNTEEEASRSCTRSRRASWTARARRIGRN